MHKFVRNQSIEVAKIFALVWKDGNRVEYRERRVFHATDVVVLDHHLIVFRPGVRNAQFLFEELEDVSRYRGTRWLRRAPDFAV